CGQAVLSGPRKPRRTPPPDGQVFGLLDANYGFNLAALHPAYPIKRLRARREDRHPKGRRPRRAPLDPDSHHSGPKLPLRGRVRTWSRDQIRLSIETSSDLRGIVRVRSDAPLDSHSPSFDQRRRLEALRIAMATAFFWPTRTTSRFPRVAPV